MVSGPSGLPYERHFYGKVRVTLGESRTQPGSSHTCRHTSNCNTVCEKNIATLTAFDSLSTTAQSISIYSKNGHVKICVIQGQNGGHGQSVSMQINHNADPSVHVPPLT